MAKKTPEEIAAGKAARAAGFAAARETKAKAAAETKRAALANPITGGAPNTFTKAKGVTLTAPTASRPFGPNLEGMRPVKGTAKEPMDPSVVTENTAENAKRAARNVVATKRHAEDATRLRAAHLEATGPDGNVDAQVGYRKPENMGDRHFAWLMGGSNVFRNDAAAQRVPAINEPHDPDPGVPVQRRAEDLSGAEYGRGAGVVAHYGHGKEDPMGSLVDTTTRSLHRVLAEHAQAGVNESASQKFYGGGVNTEIPAQPDMETAHYTGVMAARTRFLEGTRRIVQHPEAVKAMQHLSPIDKGRAATNMMALSTSEVSPRARWKTKTGWPNMEHAEASVIGGLTGQEPVRPPGAGFTENGLTAAAHVAQMVHEQDYSTSRFFGKGLKSAKTTAFVGGVVNRNSPDAYTTSDVHHGGAMLPGTATAKSTIYSGGGKDTNTSIFPDQPASYRKGMQPVSGIDPLSGKMAIKKGPNRAEDALSRGGGTVHALNDFAMRKSMANMGLSRSVNHADLAHEGQAGIWGSQQVLNPTTKVSHAENYPVARDWGHEGMNVPNDANDPLGSLARGDTHTHMGPQFRLNPNTNHRINPTKTKPYPVMPGD